MYDNLTRTNLEFAHREAEKRITELEKENAELKTKYSHNCPNCAAFGKHCPHKVNGDPYFYDCYLTVVELEEENAKLKEINGRTLGQLNLSNGELIIENEKLKKENAELKAKNKWYSEQVCNKECAEVWGQLTKAKEFLRMVIDSYNLKERFPFEKDLIKAEQFLKEVSKL